MAHTFAAGNFQVQTYEPLSALRKNIMISSMLAARSRVRAAEMMTYEALAVVSHPGAGIASLPPTFVTYFKTLFRCGSDAEMLLALPKVGVAVSTLYRGLNSPLITFIEWGMDFVTDAINTLGTWFGTSLYSPGDKAMVRGFSLKSGMYVGADAFQGCLNTAKISGNPNHIMLKLRTIDDGIAEMTDTIVHECTHKFLGTDDDGMRGASFSWIANGALTEYLRDSPGVPLPFHTPGFLHMNPLQAMGNAYVLTAYILYTPNQDISGWHQIQARAQHGHLGSQTALGQHLRAGLLRRRGGH